ncbi:hypothetical protein BHU72_02160 [Desulfuribacillus stibiiarsenatis]|uniref:STAS domain-containing protein n=1 Tax=Desulfuribacillus stibiiarsenatis TaxID=1390249 RepID=A0A1E5L6K4_9FIRM|nr:STAS domain-containing protein [Desulfuribacillus stibiiarsenatis]OEH85624.1 hypothetical protein BHU72_02160 [Desulfuribacillus stibiiarsenatis]
MLTLPESLNIYNVASYLDTLKEVFESSNYRIMLDGSLNQDIDASGVQLLLAVNKTCNKNNGSLKILGPSPTLSKYLKITGATELIQ